MIPSPRCRRATLGFSLTEVVIALGVVTFSLLAIVGMLPVGLQAVKNANEQAAAAEVLQRIAEALRRAPAVSPATAAASTYQTVFAQKSIAYTLGATGAQTILWKDLSLDGEPASQGSPARLQAILQITASPDVSLQPASGALPPRFLATPGRAIISIAWGANPQLRWAEAEQKWENAEGQISLPILFFPQDP